MTVLVIFYATCCVSHPSQMVTQTKKSRNYGRNELNHEIISISSSPCDWSFWERIHFRFFGVASGKRDNKYTGITLMSELSVLRSFFQLENHRILAFHGTKPDITRRYV